MMGRVLFHLALADWRERSRRPAFWIALACMPVLAVLFLPDPSTSYHTVDVGGWRGRYDSAWIGMCLTLTTLPLMPMLGFFLVKNAIARDEASGVGSLLATTGMGKAPYLAGKFLSNLVVLFCLVAVLALAGAGVQLWIGEVRQVDLFALAAPLCFLLGPVMVLSAAFALLFETLPGLRGGAGNLLWCFAVLVGLGMDAEFGGGVFLMDHAVDMLSAQVRALDPGYDGSISVGYEVPKLAGLAGPVFTWRAMDWSAELLAQRALLTAAVLPLLALAYLGFHRFEKTRQAAPASAPSEAVPAGESEAWKPQGLMPLAATRGGGFVQALLGEWRLLRGRHGRFWWLLVAGLNVAAPFVPAEGLLQWLVPVLWLLPALAWSELGNRAVAHRVDALVYASVAPLRHQVLAAYLSSVGFALAVVAVPLAVLAARAEGAALLNLAAGAVFVPALALACGLLSQGGKLFQALYALLWYAGPLNHAPGLDFIGGKPEAAMPLAFAGMAAVLLALAWGTGTVRLRLR